MIESIQLLASGLILALTVAPLVLRMRLDHVFYLQLGLLPLTHIYASGLALAVTAIWWLGFARTEVPRPVLITWGLWGIATLISSAQNGATSRMLFQMCEFCLYGALMVLAFHVTQDPRARTRTLEALAHGALVACLICLGSILLEGAWPDRFWGRNECAFYLVFAGVVAPAALAVQKSSSGAIYYMLVIAASILTIHVAESRGGLVVALLQVALLLLTKLSGTSLWKMALGLVAVSALVFSSSAARDELLRLFDMERNFSNIERVAMVETCIDLFWQRPWTGWGWGSLEYLLPQVSYSQNDYPHPHNTYAHFAAELGVVGLAALLLLIATCGTSVWNCYRQRRYPESLLATLTLLGLIGLGFVEDYFYGANRGVIAAIAFGLLLSLRVAPGGSIAQQSAASPARPRFSWKAEMSAHSLARDAYES